jgi:hypothetical protein
MPYTSDTVTVTFGTTPATIVGVGSVNYSFSRSAIDTTSLGVANTYSLPGIANAAVALELFFDIESANHEVILLQAWTSTAAEPIILKWSNTATHLCSIEGSARCVSIDISSVVGDLVRMQASFIFNGGATYTKLDSAPVAMTLGFLEA